MTCLQQTTKYLIFNIACTEHLFTRRSIYSGDHIGVNTLNMSGMFIVM